MIDDARVVLEWMGMRVAVINGELRWDTTDCDHSLEEEYYGEDMLDANWIHGTLVPALEERLRLKTFTAVHHMDGFWVVELQLEHEATGPTFEAAMLAAAAAAIRGATDE